MWLYIAFVIQFPEGRLGLVRPGPTRNDSIAALQLTRWRRLLATLDIFSVVTAAATK